MRAQVDSQTAHIGNQSLDESGESSGKKNENELTTYGHCVGVGYARLTKKQGKANRRVACG